MGVDVKPVVTPVVDELRVLRAYLKTVHVASSKLAAELSGEVAKGLMADHLASLAGNIEDADTWVDE